MKQYYEFSIIPYALTDVQPMKNIQEALFYTP